MQTATLSHMQMIILIKVVEHLEKDSLALIEWFSCNQMKANPDKFQALAIGKKSMDKNIVLDLAGNKIKCEKEV